MKNVSPANNSARKFAAQGKLRVKAMRNLTSQRGKIVRALGVGILLLSMALVPSVTPFAQKKEGPVQVTGVSSRKSGESTVVTVSADAPLTRTQTWQDDEGFHLVMPSTGPGSLKAVPRGVTVRNLGKSLEVVVAVKKGVGVTVAPQFNHLNLIVNGQVDTSQGEASLAAPSAKQNVEPQTDYEPAARQPRQPRAVREADSYNNSYESSAPQYNTPQYNTPRPSSSANALPSPSPLLPSPTPLVSQQQPAQPQASPAPNAALIPPQQQQIGRAHV